MRIRSAPAARGSQKWMQRAVETRPDLLCPPNTARIDWRSPLASDDYAEYRDASALRRLDLEELKEALAAFWPGRGPQWDGLGRAGDRVYLVEAKAHLNEFFSSPCAAKGASRQRIEDALAAVRGALGSTSGVHWTDRFYQLANRLAHLFFFRDQGVDAKLLLVSFVNDDDMNGPASAAEWLAAYRTASYAMGLSKNHPLAAHVVHVFPDVRLLETA